MGFYAGRDRCHSRQQGIARTSPFSRSNFDQIFKYNLERAKEKSGVENIPKAATLVYKFHLFDGVFQPWATHWRCRFGINIDVVQPDTLNRNLMALGIQGRRTIVVGNGYADIIHHRNHVRRACVLVFKCPSPQRVGAPECSARETRKMRTGHLRCGTGVKCHPSPGERVFDKKALFDSFLVPEFSEHVSGRGSESQKGL